MRSVPHIVICVCLSSQHCLQVPMLTALTQQVLPQLVWLMPYGLYVRLHPAMYIPLLYLSVPAPDFLPSELHQLNHSARW